MVKVDIDQMWGGGVWDVLWGGYCQNKQTNNNKTNKHTPPTNFWQYTFTVLHCFQNEVKQDLHTKDTGFHLA